MADPQAVAAAEPSDIHYQTVSQRVPAWLLASSAQQRQALRASVPQPMPWLADAAINLPDVVAALREEGQRHQLHARAVDACLQALPNVETFAEPLLRDALRQQCGLDLDVRRTFLFNATRARLHEARFNASEPLVEAFQVLKGTTQSLLQAALQNFEAFEAAPDGLRDDYRPSKVFSNASGQALEPGTTVDLIPERFAALCRELDLGARYQRQIEALFNPAPQPDETAQAAMIKRQGSFKQLEQSTFRLNLHLAYLQSWIGQGFYDDLLKVADSSKPEGTLQRSTLRLWEVELNGIVLFFQRPVGDAPPQKLLVYLPDEPRQAFEEFASIHDFNRSLCQRLRDDTWRAWFLRFIPARERDRLVQRILRTLAPNVWNPGGWYEAQPDPNAVLGLSRADFSAPLFDHLLQRKIAVLKDDGLFHAVPTAAEDHKSMRDKIDYFLGLAFDVANIAAFVVPGLGEVMLAVNAAMLGYEVYEGFDSLSKGEKEEAWGYFMDVGENLALVAAMGAAGQVARRFTGNLPAAVRGMRPVTLADGSTRLWKPDIAPFAYEVRLPAGLQPGDNGLYSWQGRQWLALEGRYYSVRELLGPQPLYSLEHPERAWAYEPDLRHNGNGGWLHEADTPQEWRGMQLFRRQGHREAAVSAQTAQRALRISGTSEAHLRQSLADSQRPPALLTDTLRRLVLAEDLAHARVLHRAGFDSVYHAQQPPLSAAGQRLQRAFDDLPNGLVEEIVGAASAPELDELAHSASVPQRLADEARAYRQQLRIARACEGLYLDLPLSPDSARLLLHSLEGLPNWPSALRLELHRERVGGKLLASIGNADQTPLTVVWRGQLPGEFCADLFAVLPEEARTQLGIGDAVALRAQLQTQPWPPRQRLREWLGMRSRKPGFRSPMRLADGRIGYPLSGRGIPFFTEDELLDKLRLLELEELYAEDALQALYRVGMDRAAVNARLDRLLAEMGLLRGYLDRWALESAGESLSAARQCSRERIGQALWDHWRRGVLPELGRPTPRLILWQVHLEDLPTQLPEFFRDRVREVLFDEVALREGQDDERLIGENALQAFSARFPNITALDIRGGHWHAGLPQMVARTFPRLNALGLREVDRLISLQDMRALATLPGLRRLSLRGSRVGEMPATALNGLVLDYLGLDLLGLEYWPYWLDNAALDRIGELSLVGNQLREVPESMLADRERVVRPIRVLLRGNRFDYQALLDMALAQRFQGRFLFELDLSPQMSDALYQRVLERAQLQAALQVWSDPMQVPAPLSAVQVAYRQRVSRQLLVFWREALRDAGAATLNLDELVLEVFPGNLPPFFPSRVQRLDLTRFSGGPEALERLLGQFPQLRQLTLAHGQPAMTSVPECLLALPHLRRLSLVQMGLTVDQAAIDALAGMPMLSWLRLDGNRLGEISDVSALGQRFLGLLGLSRMGISTWPAWLDPLLPNGIGLLNLDENALQQLPAYLLENRVAETGAVAISLRNNPLSRETLIQAHLSQRTGHPYSFSLDLPEDIAAMQVEDDTGVGSSDSSESDSDSQQGGCSWQDLLEKLDRLELDEIFAGGALHALYRSGLDLDAIGRRLDSLFDERELLRRHLEDWDRGFSGQSLGEARQRSRERIANAFWDHWRRTLLPELEPPQSPLVLWQVLLADLPAQLPEFFRQRVHSLLLDDMLQGEGPVVAQQIGEAGLHTLAGLFPDLTSLDIRGGRWLPGLAAGVARTWPQLQALALREQGNLLGHPDLQVLLAMPRLRRLELRGSRLRDMPATTLHGARLDYLGLDWLDLQEWPQWLDNTALTRVGELSMVGNQISEIPTLILCDTTPVPRPLRIALQGNQFRHQALLDMLLAERFQGRFHFVLELSPGLSDVLNQRVLEHQQLQATLSVWTDPLLDPALQAPGHVAYRQGVARELLRFWRDEVRGGGTAILNLEDVIPDEFPGNLPGFFTARVQRLELVRFYAGTASLERLIGRFPQLRELSLIRGQPALTRVPAFLTRFPELRELALVHMGMTIDQAAMESFARIPLLSSLQLDGNRLGQITDVSMFGERFLGFLGMAQMQVSSFPDWLGDMLPDGVELLSLDDNQLTSLPEWMLENRRTQTGAVEISLRNNPLTREVLIRAHTSQHYDRPYSFTLDLPEDIAAMEREVHTSDSEDGDSALDDVLSDYDPASIWTTGDHAEDVRNQGIRERLVADGDAEALLGLVALLRYSADYRSLATRAELVGRVWTVLAAAARDRELRLTLNGMAEEPVDQLNSHETCPDGIRLEFNQMEFQVHTRQALRDIPEGNRGPALFRLMRGIFRAQTLDRLAREQGNGRDEAEVRLAYRLRWAEELQLPAPPRSMLYRGAANLAAGELDQAMTRVQQEEAGQGLVRFAAECDFWVAYLREAFADRFKAVREGYEAAVLNATEAYPEDTAEQSAARIRGLEETFRMDEQGLLESLTREYALSVQ